MVILGHFALGGHRNRHAADPLPQIQIVRALVEQHAAPFARPCGAPAAGIIIGLRPIPVGDQPVGAFDRTHLARSNDLLHFAVNMIGALIKHHGKHTVRFCRHLIHAADLFCIHAGRLFAHDMQVILHRLDRQTRVIVMRHRNMHRVHQSALNQRGCRIKPCNAVAKLLFRPFQTLRIDIRHRREHHPLDIAFHNAEGMHGAHAADTDDPHSDLFHADLPFLYFNSVSM